MKLLAHFLAEQANFSSDGTFTVFKGGITVITAPSPVTTTNPALARFAVVTALEFTLDEAEGRLHEVQLSLMLPDHSFHQGGRLPIAVNVPDRSLGRVYANVQTQINLLVPSEGDVIISGLVDGESLPLLYLNVRSARPT